MQLKKKQSFKNGIFHDGLGIHIVDLKSLISQEMYLLGFWGGEVREFKASMG